jgi:hypothetical protein
MHDQNYALLLFILIQQTLVQSIELEGNRGGTKIFKAVAPREGREKAKKLGILLFMYWVLLTTYIFFALLEIVMCLKHIEASHVMAFNS